MSAAIPAWMNQYLNHLDLQPEPPSLSFLERLLRAHLHRIPFENISKLHYYRRLDQLGWKVPPSEVWVQNVITRDFGGTCYTINSTLYRVLSALGYETRLMRVSGGGHMSVGVRLNGSLYLVDAGLGAPLFAPVDLAVPSEANRFGRGIRVYPMQGEPGAYHMDHYLDGERKMAWTFSTMPEPLEQFTPNIEYSYSPTGYFMVFMTCSLYQEHRHVALRNNLFTVRQPNGTKSVRELRSVDEFEHVLATEFGLPGLPVREAIETLTSIGVDPFAPAMR